MPIPHLSPGRGFTDGARKAALAAKAAKRAEPNTFGLPEMFVVRVDGRTFTWELRRFGGVLMERGIVAYASQALARADGKAALAFHSSSPDLPTFKRELL